MEKIYNKTQWENTPSTNTPINETNLNNIENGVDALDDRVVELSNTKSNVDWVQLQKSGDKIAEITIDGVKKTVYAKRGSGGGGGGTTDYEDLDNKPKINNVELNGNKTLSDLGINAESVGALPNTTVIPTTLAELAEDTTHRTVTDEEKAKWDEGGGGSSVSWNQIVTSGTKIAEVSVDGNKTDVYAPNGGSGGGGTASDITYDNSTSGMTATNVQDAIDEQKQDLTHFVGGDEWVQKTYNEGDVCIHNNKAWYCLATTTTEPSSSDTTHWKQISLKEIELGLNNTILPKETLTSGDLNYLTKAGLYYYGYSASSVIANTPNKAMAGILVVFPMINSTAFQMVVGTNHVYLRFSSQYSWMQLA